MEENKTEEVLVESSLAESNPPENSLAESSLVESNPPENSLTKEAAPTPKKKRKTNKRDFLKGSLAGLCAGVVIAGIAAMILLGYKNAQIRKANEEVAAVNDMLAGDSACSLSTLMKVRAMAELIDKQYYLKDVSNEDIENGIYRGVAASLDDSYAQYFTPEELKEQTESNMGIYGGVGAYIGIDPTTGYAMFSGVMEGTPAEEADIRPGDIIYEIDGVNTAGMTLDDVVSRVKGEENTLVEITIVRGTEKMIVPITRKNVNVPTVKQEMMDGDIGYIQIRKFDTVTIDQFAEALAVVKGSNAKGLIIDLRSNPGGLLTAALGVANQILPKGLVVYTQDKQGKREEYSCDGKRELELPLVVLVDGNSASAAEILTGAIKDYGLGTIMGTTTYGKGIVQQTFRMSDGSALKMTISGYYTPKGNNIHEKGIEPDVEVEFDADAYYGEERFDNQKQAAWEYLMKEIQ